MNAADSNPLPHAAAADESPLDTPIWSALTPSPYSTTHSTLAVGDSLARRYPPEIGPLAALAEQTEAAYESLRVLAGDATVVQFLPQPWQPRPGWTLVRSGSMDQMLWQPMPGTVPGTDIEAIAQRIPPTGQLRQLEDSDSPAMVALATLTEPGPFGPRTHTLGPFFGIFEEGALVAMTGQRLRIPGYTEISAVCTHPSVRGKGYSRILIAQAVQDILSRGERPMLHVFSANAPAIRVYRSLGFTLRRNLELAVVRPE